MFAGPDGPAGSRVSAHSTPLAIALSYADAGFPVFPCNPLNKKPLTKHGFKDASTDAAYIRNMWRRHPNAMPAMPTGEASGTYVVDLDVDRETGEFVGERTIESFGLLEALNTGLAARTPSGGRHVYFAYPGEGFGNTAGATRGLGPSVDTRGEGGYVILPGSVNAEGKRYEWLGDGLVQVGREGPTPLPQSIREVLQRPRASTRKAQSNPDRSDRWAQTALSEEIAKVAGAPVGSRNDALFSASAALAEICAGGHLDWTDVSGRLRSSAMAVGLEPDETDTTIESGWQAGSRNPRGPAEPNERRAGSSTGANEITEDAVARRFTDIHRDDLRYDHDRGNWLTWTGDHWAENRTGMALNECRLIARRLSETRENHRSRTSVRKWNFAFGAERLAQRDPVHAVTQDVWDQNAFLLGCPDVTIDLSTGAAYGPRQEDMITKRVAVAPSDTPNCPIWIRFLEETTGDDPDLVRFLQRTAGYCLTGDTREHALFFFYGPGGNGKSVFLNTICGILGDYAITAAMDAFTASRGDRHTTELAMMRGARLVTASETEEGRPWAESRIKALTGGDPITARFMRQDNFTFRPEFKLLIAGNHKPVLRNVDDAARRRFNIIPFTRKPAAPDPLLETKLCQEWPGILRWMIEGCLDWQANRLARPAAVMTETDAYFETQDTLGQWLDEECLVELGNEHRWETAAGLFESWSAYCDRLGERAGSQKAFGDRLTTRGFTQCKKRLQGKQQRSWQGLSLLKGLDSGHGRDGWDGS